MNTIDLGKLIDQAAGSSGTTEVDSVDLENVRSRGLKIYINVTNANSSNVTVTIQGKDPISGQYFTILASAALNSNGLTVLTVYPGLTASTNVVASDVIPFWYRIKAVAGASGVAYTVSGSLIA